MSAAAKSMQSTLKVKGKSEAKAPAGLSSTKGKKSEKTFGVALGIKNTGASRS
jgi:hypothetical protein